jgi:hypothetical protein
MVEPTDILPNTLSHILYCFADVDPNSGTIILSDLYADEQVLIQQMCECMFANAQIRNIILAILGTNLYVLS